MKALIAILLLAGCAAAQTDMTGGSYNGRAWRDWSHDGRSSYLEPQVNNFPCDEGGGRFIYDDVLVVAEELRTQSPAMHFFAQGAGYPVGHSTKHGPASGGHRSRYCDDRIRH